MGKTKKPVLGGVSNFILFYFSEELDLEVELRFWFLRKKSNSK
jgi:hypothetical protein